VVAGSSLALCEGGQTCLPPKECCAQGCCYLYAPPGAPRIPMANNEHVLSLLFLNHWYFWCFMFAIVLALLCTCSLWRKRRQLCGWDASARHSQSEGDSAGSCYAPPQYSRCNSFHIHAPPPYTEVASKPDLYPLVFSYTDPGKGNGANYLMVQYFRNYIVQPVGSISGTSTVDSLSSSFICNANEANTLVPPPYSRAASPDSLPMAYRNYLMPRSASQQVCLAAYAAGPVGARSQTGGYHQRDDDSLLLDQQQCMVLSHRPDDPVNATTINHNHSGSSSSSSRNNVSLMATEHGPSQPSRTSAASGSTSGQEPDPTVASSTESFDAQQAARYPVGRPGPASDNCDPDAMQPGALVCKLCCSTGDIAVPMSDRRRYRGALHKSLETCCHVSGHGGGGGDSVARTATATATTATGLQPADSDDDSSLLQPGVVRKCVVSSVDSNVSSLVNLDSASSPPRATSPTAEVRELLEQIRQLHSAEDASPAPEPMPAQRPPPAQTSYRRPSSLIGRRTKLFSKPSPTPHHGSAGKGLYIPISFTQSCMAPGAGGSGGHRPLRSPASMSSAASSFLNRGRQRYCWMSKSAPTTPGTGPGSFTGGPLSDNRPLLLTEQEEDGEQNV
uniref:WW domain binding protein VOPP1 n=1 Tax=Anopheles epiroticus TaxID=199890 RepID=A0A182PBH9_9DIPT